MTRILAPNPGPMTLDGTNSYLIGDPESGRIVVVDPGPDDSEHLAGLADAGVVQLILLTHRHIDHVEGASALAASTNARVRAADPALCNGADPLRDGEVIRVAGTRIRVVATPGHTSDSVCFALPDDSDVDTSATRTSVLTGDTILGRGTTVIAHPDGTVSDYLASLERLRDVGDARVFPAHGPMLSSLVDICDNYLAHRRSRLEQLQGALRKLGIPASLDSGTVHSVIDMLYADVDASLLPAARASVRAQLVYLAELH